MLSTAMPFQLHEMFILFITIFPPTQVPKSAVTNPDDLELWLKVITQIYGELYLLISEVIEHMMYDW
jgi:hypothetical protein